jgi:hypothetical protein
MIRCGGKHHTKGGGHGCHHGGGRRGKQGDERGADDAAKKGFDQQNNCIIDFSCLRNQEMVLRAKFALVRTSALFRRMIHCLDVPPGWRRALYKYQIQTEV